MRSVFCSALSSAVVKGLGEAGTLADASVIYGVFTLRADLPGAAFDRSASGFGSDVGRAMRLSQQLAPRFSIEDADAVSLAEQDTIQIRGDDYLITRIDPDGYGITVVELMPSPEDDPVTEHSRWR